MEDLYIFLATYAIAAPVVLFGIQFLLEPRENKVRFFAITMAACLLALLVAKVANLFIIQPRPFVVGNFAPLIPHAPDNGFPSDHALFAAALAALSSYFSLRFGIAMWVMAVAVGIGRILTGVHHATDVLGAFAIAVLSVFLVVRIAARWRS